MRICSARWRWSCSTTCSRSTTPISELARATRCALCRVGAAMLDIVFVFGNVFVIDNILSYWKSHAHPYVLTSTNKKSKWNKSQVILYHIQIYVYIKTIYIYIYKHTCIWEYVRQDEDDRVRQHVRVQQHLSWSLARAARCALWRVGAAMLDIVSVFRNVFVFDNICTHSPTYVRIRHHTFVFEVAISPVRIDNHE